MTRVPNEMLEYTDEDLYLLDGVPFSGVSVFEDRAGQVIAEHEYRQGMRWGISRGWHNTGQIAYEEECRQGLLHGLRREWLVTGELCAAETFEYGVRTTGRRWDNHGRLTEDFTLTPEHPDFGTLDMYKKAYKRAGLDGAED